MVPLVLAAAAEPSDDDGFPDVTERPNDPFDRIHKALQRYGRIFLWIGVGLAALLAIKIVSPVQIFYGVQDRRLQRAVRPVDELLKRIGKEAETAGEAPKEETAIEGGVLAGMMEIAEFEQAEQAPPYVLTVNDTMLDNIALTLKRLRPFHDGKAEKYQGDMFTVLQGIKTITEHSAEANVPSGLAVDVEEYFKDERRYRTWRKVLGRWTGKGRHQETAVAFLSFMRMVREGRSPAAPKSTTLSMGDTAVAATVDAPDVPEVLSEETLPAVQEAAVEEARNLCDLIAENTPKRTNTGWQFEFIHRQQQIRTRDEAQRTLNVFLLAERKALQEITKNRMLPCRTWEHVLHVLGVENTAQLRKRAENRLLTTQEILILEKAFLQTFARRESLSRIYGQGQEADLMIDAHVPEIRRESLAVLRRLNQTQRERLTAATETLNEEETPQNGLAKSLIERYMK